MANPTLAEAMAKVRAEFKTAHQALHDRLTALESKLSKKGRQAKWA